MFREQKTVVLVLLGVGVAALWGAMWLGSGRFGQPAARAAEAADLALERKLADLLPEIEGGPALVAWELRVSALGQTLVDLETPPAQDTARTVAALCVLARRWELAQQIAAAAELDALAALLRTGEPARSDETLLASVEEAGLHGWLGARVAAAVADRYDDPEIRLAASDRVHRTVRRLTRILVAVGGFGALFGLAGVVLLLVVPWFLRRWLEARPRRSTPFRSGARTVAGIGFVWFFGFAAVGVALALLGGLSVGWIPIAAVVVLQTLGSGSIGVLLARSEAQGMRLSRVLALDRGLNLRAAGWVLGGLCVAVPTVLLLQFLASLVLGPAPPPPALDALAADPSPLSITAIVIAVVGLAPFFEEVFFRGYVYRALRESLGLPAAMFFSSLSFAAAHVSLGTLLPLTALGALFALVREATGSLWASIALHAAWNLLSLAVAWLTLG